MRAKRNFFVAVVFALGVASVALDHAGWLRAAQDLSVQLLSPAQAVLSGFSSALDQVIGSLPPIGRSRASAEETLQIQELTAEVARLREVDMENRRLVAELNFKKANPDWELLAANIIGYDPTNFVKSIIVDKGVEQGVQDGMVVITPAGLAGKVTRAYPTSSKVLLVVDPGLIVNGMIQRPDSRALGIVKGDNSGKLVMRYLPADEKINEGDLVMTSGIGGGFPKGLYLGRVIRVVRSDVELFQEVMLEPAVHLGRLERVLIISNFTPNIIP